MNRESFKNLYRVEIGLEAGGYLEQGRKESVLWQRKAVKGRASHRDTPWMESVSRSGAGGEESGWKGEGEQEGMRTDRGQNRNSRLNNKMGLVGKR